MAGNSYFVNFPADFCRISPVKRNEKAEERDLTQPVCIGEFPSIVREEQRAMLLEKNPHG